MTDTPAEVREALARLTAHIYDPTCRAAQDERTIRTHIDTQAAQLAALQAELAEARRERDSIRAVMGELGGEDAKVYTAACFALIDRAVTVNAKRGEFKFEAVHGADGEQYGDWIVTVEEIAAGASQP